MRSLTINRPARSFGFAPLVFVSLAMPTSSVRVISPAGNLAPSCSRGCDRRRGRSTLRCFRETAGGLFPGALELVLDDVFREVLAQLRQPPDLRLVQVEPVHRL